MSAPYDALAARALNLGSQPWNDPASRRRGALQTSLRCYERARLRALQEVADLDERIADVKAQLEVAP